MISRILIVVALASCVFGYAFLQTNTYDNKKCEVSPATFSDSDAESDNGAPKTQIFAEFMPVGRCLTGGHLGSKGLLVTVDPTGRFATERDFRTHNCTGVIRAKRVALGACRPAGLKYTKVWVKSSIITSPVTFSDKDQVDAHYTGDTCDLSNLWSAKVVLGRGCNPSDCVTNEKAAVHLVQLFCGDKFTVPATSGTEAPTTRPF